MGGLALLAIPNYSGVYARLQQYFDPENLKIHNLEIMDCKALAGLTPTAMASEIDAFPSGRLSPWLINFSKRWPAPLATSISHAFNVVGLLQPFEIEALCPLLVLTMRRR